MVKSVIAGVLALASLSAAPRPRTFVGTISDDMCWKAGHARMQMGPTDAECTIACVASHGAAYVLVVKSAVYTLSENAAPERFAGKKVKVTGILDDKTKAIRVESIALALAAAVVRPSAQQPSTKRINRIIEQFEQGKPAFVNTHWDWIEMEIGIYDVTELQKRLTALKKGKEAPEVTPVLRVPIGGDEPFQWIVKQGLQLGLSTIVVPQVDTKEQAMALVAAMRLPQPLGAKYPEPQGARSSGAPKASAYWGLSGSEYSRRADVWPLNPDGEMLAIVMVESKTAVDHVNEILNVPGLGGIMLGPADLRASIGIRTKADGVQAETEAAIQKALSACLAKKKMICAIAGVSAADRDRRIKEGWHMIHGNFGPPS